MPGSSSQSSAAERYGTLALIRRLLIEHAFGHWRRYCVAFALMAISASCTALSAYLFGDVINQAYVHRNLTGIIALGGATFAIFAIKGAATYGHSVIMSRIGISIIAANQRRMFNKVLNESIGYFADRHSSEFIARLTTGANAASHVINLLVTAIGRDFLSLVGLVTVMVVQDPVMSLVTLVVAPPALVALRKLVRRIRTIAHNQFTGGARIIETMQEALQGLRIIKAFTLEDAMQRRFDDNVGTVEHESYKMARVANRASPLMEMLGGFAMSIAVVYGGYRVIATGATPGEFFSFMAAFLLAYEPAKRLARLNLDLNSNLIGVRVLFEVIDSPPTEPNDDDKPLLELDKARVEFSDVRFSYRSGEPVIRDMSFVAEPGKVTALVGASGGGKSTVLDLILRLHEVGGGTITIDGKNIAAVSRGSLRRQIAYVGQNVQLFRGSVRDNIGFGKLGASEAEIIAAAMPMTSSWRFPPATTPRSANTGCSCPAASASVSRSRAR